MWFSSGALNYIICLLRTSRNEQTFRNEGHVMSVVQKRILVEDSKYP